MRATLLSKDDRYSSSVEKNTFNFFMTFYTHSRWRVFRFLSNLISLDNVITEQRRSYSRLCLFYKIIYGLVAIDMPPYVVHPLRTLRNSHTLGFRQIKSTVDYYKYTHSIPSQSCNGTGCQHTSSAHL